MHCKHFLHIGIVAAAVGFCLVSGAFERDATVSMAGWGLGIVGAMLICSQRVCAMLDKVNRPADEAWSEGYEAGFDKGWRDGNTDARPVLALLKGTDDGVGRETANRQISG